MIFATPNPRVTRGPDEYGLEREGPYPNPEAGKGAFLHKLFYEDAAAGFEWVTADFACRVLPSSGGFCVTFLTPCCKREHKSRLETSQDSTPDNYVVQCGYCGQDGISGLVDTWWSQHSKSSLADAIERYFNTWGADPLDAVIQASLQAELVLAYYAGLAGERRAS